MGSGRDRDRGGLPDFLTNSGHVGMPYPEFSSIFPGLFRSEKIGKNRGKSEKIEGHREKSREIGDNPYCSRLTSNFLKDWDGHLDLSRSAGMSQGG